MVYKVVKMVTTSSAALLGIYIGVYANQNYEAGTFVTCAVIGVLLDQEFKLPRVWNPNTLTDRLKENMDKLKQEIAKYKKDS